MQMGFISFGLVYYINELQELESSAANPETIYRAQQLLKILDDLLDEGYTELNETLEKSCQGVSRLRKYLKDNHTEPFSICPKATTEADLIYETDEIELSRAIDELVICSTESDVIKNDAFLAELIRFCEWVGYEEDTAYIFLLRDTLLPYIYYQNKNRTNIHPWLLSRKTLTLLTGKEFVDDVIRASIIKALEFGKYNNYEDFCKIVLPDIRSALKQYPEIENCFTDLLNTIEEKHIIVIESGCSGTFPMLLKSLDDRVDVRMYTTYPYLLKVYGDRIFSPKYEEIRLFETLCSQDLYFQFSALKDSHFYVRKCRNEEVIVNSFAEVKTIMN